jgi:hypothetical protein
METNMKQSESTYYDIPERKECIKLWRDVGNSDILKPGPYKGVDLVCDKYNIEVAWSHKKENPSPHPWPDGPLEYRLEDRKLRYWVDEDFNYKPTHYVCFLKDMDKAVIWWDKNIREWINTCAIEYRGIKGWSSFKNNFLIVPATESPNMQFCEKPNGMWVKK